LPCSNLTGYVTQAADIPPNTLLYSTPTGPGPVSTFIFCWCRMHIPISSPGGNIRIYYTTGGPGGSSYLAAIDIPPNVQTGCVPFTLRNLTGKGLTIYVDASMPANSLTFDKGGGVSIQ
jgi:hypothetical protein